MRRDSEYVVGLTAKTQALLAYLAIEADHPHRRDALAGLLWGEVSDAAARNNLRQSLHQVQNALGETSPPFLLVTPQTIQFNPSSDYWLDVNEFTQLLDECDHHAHRHRETCRACHARLQRAADLYRGPLFANFSLKDSNAFEEWAMIKREHLARRALAAFGALADYHARHHAYAPMEDAARRQIAIDAFDEDAHRRVMRACAWSGRRNAALAQYEECRRLLKEELDAEPASETQKLFEDVRDGNFESAPAAVPTNLPIQLTSFIGREEEIRQAQDMLDKARLLTLTGVGGCGKTRLALQVAANLVEEFPDGVWFVDLAPRADPALVPPSIAGVLGVREQPGHSLSESVAEHLRAKNLLLILDNCEHLLEACAQFADGILRAAPQVQLLVTGRETVGIQGEQVLFVPSLQVPDSHSPADIEELARVESVRLFVERATAVCPQFELTNANAHAVAQICQRLDGIPLAIELAAARTRALSVGEIARRLDERFQLLIGSGRVTTPRHQTLRAALDWSYNLLSTPERLLLHRLAVFTGGWTLAAAETVCSDEHLPRGEILESLTRLVDKSLIVLDSSERGASRYRMLETIRQYAHEKLRESDDAMRVRQQHFDFFLELATEAGPQLTSTERGVWLERLDAEHDNLRAAIRWSVERCEIESRLQLVGVLADFWHGRGYFTEGRAHLEQALAARQPLETAPHSPALAKALDGAGMLAWMQSDYAVACPRLEMSAKMWRELGNKWELAYPLMILAWTEYQRGNYSAGTVLAEESIAVSRESGNDRTLGLALTYLGVVALDRGDYATANRNFEETEPLVRASGDKWNLASTLTWYGHGKLAQGEYTRATELGKEALVLYREVGEKWGMAWALHNLGYVARAQGDYAQAITHLKDSLALWQELGNPFGLLQVLAGFAAVMLSRGYRARAARLFSATDALLGTLGAKLYPLDQSEYERNLAALRAQLDAATFATAWEEGHALNLDQAIALALADDL
jgi:predicted ATPase/DNA-binding SARP family transcriptional activator